MTPRTVGNINYHLFPGTDRKTADIVIERNGQVVVRPPARLSQEQVDEFVASKRFWIYRNLARWLVSQQTDRRDNPRNKTETGCLILLLNPTKNGRITLGARDQE